MANLNPNGSVAGNAQNIPEAHVPRTRSTFPLKRHFFNTHRFGEYIPHFFADLNKDEDFPINSSSTLRTYTLKSPLMQNVTRNKDYFLVPMEAILPLNWEKFFDNPVRGDDVLDDVGPTVENFWSKAGTMCTYLRSSLRTVLADTTIPVWTRLQAVFRFLVLVEYFYSSGNLLSSLGCHGSPYFRAIQRNSANSDGIMSFGLVSWDDVYDQIVGIIAAMLGPDSNGIGSNFVLTVDGWVYTVADVPDFGGLETITLRHALQLMRDNPTFVINNADYNSLNPSRNWNNVLQSISDLLDPNNLASPDSASIFRPAEVDCNLSRLWAYQLSVAHYFTNDHIDYVYSAELFRQLIGNYIHLFSNQPSFFTRNGIDYQYDYLSAYYCSFMMSASAATWQGVLTNTSSTSSTGKLYNARIGYLSALFGYRRSLRYLDYFTGSRAQPLAVVNTSQISTNVAVNSNQVSVIDITKSIQAQRFLNSVNRVRHNFEGYLKGIFGGDVPAPDYHNPFKLAHTDDVVFGQETENTASEQMSDKIAITTNLRSHSGNYVFEIHTDRPCIAIGITSYEIPRIYTKTIDRSFFHKNRFDWFNPFMQYIGDQSVYLQELGIWPGSSSLNTMANFSYAIRHEEYKQWYHIASGGFGVPSTNLDNWIFPAIDRRGTQYCINPDWIRSLNAEFDRFYVSLSGWSLGTYFHFIVDDFNSCNASRPMAFAPQILG